MKQIINAKNSIIMTLANTDDLPELEKIEEECNTYFLFDPQCDNNHSCTIKECITVGDIPYGGKKKIIIFIVFTKMIFL